MSKISNVLFFLSDQHNPKVTSYAGDPTVQTPNLDELAASAMRFDACYCQNPLCVPSRYSMLTGRYSKSIGAYDNRHILASDSDTIPKYFAANGYRTCCIGKTHFNGEQMQGYSERPYGDFFGQGHQPNPRRTEFGENSGLGDVLGASGPLAFPLPLSQTEICVSETSKWLQNYVSSHDRRPFFLSVNFDKPHFPMTPPAEYFNKYLGKLEPETIPEHFWENAPAFVRNSIIANGAYEHYGKDPDVHRRALAAYYGCIEWVDSAVGRILSVMDYLGLSDDTIIVYSSDHGEMRSRFGAWQKSLFYDDSCRVPLLIRVPGKAPGLSADPVGLIDLYPTLCSLCGLDIPEFCEGTDAAPLLDGKSICRDGIFAESVAYKRPDQAGCMLRTGRFKYNYYLNGEEELYDLLADPDELNDISASTDCSEYRRRVVEFWKPEDQLNRYAETPMMKKEKHWYPYSNQFMSAGAIFDAMP